MFLLQTFSAVSVAVVGPAKTPLIEASGPGKFHHAVDASMWIVGRGPQTWELRTPPPSDAICWFDVGRPVDPSELFEQLEPFCDGLQVNMLEDLLTPDDIPENRRWRDGTVRLASSFGVYPPAGQARWGRGDSPPAAAVYQAVELLAGGRWLITRWHEPCLYRGSEHQSNDVEAIEKDELLEDVAKRWRMDGGGKTAGDLGVLVMHELALTYAPAHRHFQNALETWELELYGIGSEAHDAMFVHEKELRELWGARARLRDWLNPLNVSGLHRDCDKAWLPVEDHDEVKEVDKRIDDALTELSDLGDMLRHGFQLMHIRMSDAQRAQHEEAQRRLEFLATVLLVPTLIVGFYGANTWVPGDHRHWGFWVMVLAIVTLTCGAVTFVSRLHRRRRLAEYARQEELSLG